LINTTVSEKDEELFYCKGSGGDGVGEYTTEGFVVLKGSKARVDSVPSIQPSQERIRQQLAAEGIMAAQGGVYVFTRDHLFASPSMAAVALMGRSANGWGEWKTAQGQTLEAVKRQAAKSAD
jgi:Domain of unknown function (DUF4357)